MRVLIAGAGAVGGYFGGRLAHDGHDVHFVARGNNLSALARDGLKVQSIGGDFVVAPGAVSAQMPSGPFDLALICVKTYHTPALLEQMKRAQVQCRIIASLQNGVESESLVAEAFKDAVASGATHVLGALCNIGAELSSPGMVSHRAAGEVVFGPLAPADAPHAERVVAAFEAASVMARVPTDVRSAIWRKFVWNAGFNPVCALAGKTVGEALDDVALRARVEAAMAEAVEVGRRLGVTLTGDDISRALDISDKSLRAVRPSMLQDMQRGTRLEHEAFSGYIVRQGRAFGLATPVATAMYDVLEAVDVARRGEAR